MTQEEDDDWPEVVPGSTYELVSGRVYLGGNAVRWLPTRPVPKRDIG